MTGSKASEAFVAQVQERSRAAMNRLVEGEERAYELRREHERITGVYDLEGARLGRILRLDRTYRASRRSGTAEDARRVSQGFRTVESAAAWIVK